VASFAYKVRSRVVGRSSARREALRRRSQFYAEVWRAAAEATGASVTRLGDSVLELSRGDVALRVRDNLTSLDDPVTLAVAGNKPLVHRLVAARSVRVPPHLVCRPHEVAEAWRFVVSAGGPCVVKPAHASAAGAGVTTGVTTRQRLAAAMSRAGADSREVLVEPQIDGGIFRLLFLDGELLDAVERRPPTVRGDGRSSVRRLIAAENRDRVARGIGAAQTLVAIDDDLRHTLGLSGLHLRSVPAAGDIVQIKTVINDNRAEDNVYAGDRLCEAVTADAAAAAAAVGARLAGVDVITPDPARPLSESGGVVIEVNTTPGYHYHYHRSGPRAEVATMILKRVLGGSGATTGGTP
jgi:cyanophycin synthetase